MRSIELLAPAKDIECGIAAITHGADAVYIGAEYFGARMAAGNTVNDIYKLCQYAHLFKAKVYVTVNTLIYDKELDKVKDLLHSLSLAGVDAILIQDMGVFEISKSITAIPIHASTQTDNRNVEKVKWLRDLGFTRVVLARELSLDEIKAIHKSVPDIELEVFVHGALCVSYSGACYASEHCFHRSANRGECAQFCRLKFSLKDSTNRTIVKDKYLLSLKDLCLLDNLEQLIESGVSSLKIEGRLKDIVYVKNVVSAYSHELNKIIASHPGRYHRASVGKVEYSFTPNLRKTFNRGFTDYFIYGRKLSQASLNTPKAMGEYVGKVKEVRNGSFNVAGTTCFCNGDGLCFINTDMQLEGFRINKVVNNRLFPAKMSKSLRPGLALYRNNDQEFERLMSKDTAVRKIGVSLLLSSNEKEVYLKMIDENGNSAVSSINVELQRAHKSQVENMKRQLSKLGDTHYKLVDIDIDEYTQQLFIPSSVLSELRQKAVKQLTLPSHTSPDNDCGNAHGNTTIHNRPASEINVGNVSNYLARRFYSSLGMYDVPDAYEICNDRLNESPIMTCRYCIRHELGYCVKHGGLKPSWKEPLRLELPDGKKFRLEFNCKQCQMNVYAGY